MQQLKKDYPMLLVILCLVVIYEPRITLNRGLVITDDVFASDLMNDRYPVRVELERALKLNQLPLWTPLIYTGFPLQANPESGITYPVNIILFKIFSPARALNLSILLKFLLAALFMFYYLRALGIDRPSSLFASIAFSWCGFFVGHLKHLNMHDAGIWVPLILLLIEKYHADRKAYWLCLVSAVLGLQILGGHPQISYYTVLFIAVYFLWRELPGKTGWKQKLVTAGHLIAVVAVGVGAGMVQLLPGLELVGLSERGGGVSYQFANQYPYYLPDLLTFVYPYINGDPGRASYSVPGIFWEDYGYVGLLPLFFAFWAIIATIRHDRRTRFFAAALGLSGILMLGDQAFLFKILFYTIPGMNFFRFSTRFILFVDLALAVLAAIGLAHCLKKRARWAYALVIILTIADLHIMQRRQNPVVDRGKWEEIPATARILQQDTSLFRVFSIGSIESHKTAYARARGWEGDLTPYIYQREVLQPSSNMLYGISSADGYINLVPSHLIRMWGSEKQRGVIQQTARLASDGQSLLVTDAFFNLLQAFNVKYLVSIWPINHHELKLLGVNFGVFLYQYEKSRPRVFLVPEAIHLEDGAAEAMLAQGRIDLSRFVVISEPVPGHGAIDRAAADVGTVNVTSYGPDRIELEIMASRDAWLVLSDSYYPGWDVLVDGDEARIFRANLCVRALPVAEGTHSVVFRYEPRTFKTGFVITLCSFLIIALGACLAGRKRRTRANGH